MTKNNPTSGEDVERAAEYPSRGLRYAAWITLPGTLILALDFLYPNTVRTWQEGPNPGSYILKMGHSALGPVAIVPFISFVAAHVVLFIAIARTIGNLHRRRKLGEGNWLACGLLLCIVVIYIPQWPWQFAMVEVCGPGRHGGGYLAAAARKDQGFMVRALLARGVSVDADDWQGFTALNAACGENRVEMAKYLISRGADPKRAPSCDWIDELGLHPERVRAPGTTTIVVH